VTGLLAALLLASAPSPVPVAQADAGSGRVTSWRSTSKCGLPNSGTILSFEPVK